MPCVPAGEVGRGSQPARLEVVQWAAGMSAVLGPDDGGHRGIVIAHMSSETWGTWVAPVLLQGTEMETGENRGGQDQCPPQLIPGVLPLHPFLHETAVNLPPKPRCWSSRHIRSAMAPSRRDTLPRVTQRSDKGTSTHHGGSQGNLWTPTLGSSGAGEEAAAAGMEPSPERADAEPTRCSGGMCWCRSQARGCSQLAASRLRRLAQRRALALLALWWPS